MANQKWKKSSYSNGPAGTCVELSSELLIRDSKHPTGPTLHAGRGLIQLAKAMS